MLLWSHLCGPAAFFSKPPCSPLYIYMTVITWALRGQYHAWTWHAQYTALVWEGCATPGQQQALASSHLLVKWTELLQTHKHTHVSCFCNRRSGTGSQHSSHGSPSAHLSMNPLVSDSNQHVCSVHLSCVQCGTLECRLCISRCGNCCYFLFVL